MASNIDIQKKCEWCGVIFTAHKTSTAYCSHRCANLAYKERVRKKRVQEFQLKFDEEAKPHSEKEFLTPTEVSAFLGVGRTSIYRYIRYGKIKAVRFNGKTLIRRSDIDKMFDYISVSEKNKPKEKVPITNFYTTAEIKEKFGVLEIYTNRISNEVYNIISKYRKLSWNICILCGNKSEVYTTSWISPYCNDCIDKLERKPNVKPIIKYNDDTNDFE